jgi:hypothetical protein
MYIPLCSGQKEEEKVVPAFPANAADFDPPTEWQVLSPLPPDDPDDSFSNEYFHDNAADNDQAAGAREDRLWLESECARDHDPAHLEVSAYSSYPPTPHTAPGSDRPDS